jgi:hypothetical protein
MTARFTWKGKIYEVPLDQHGNPPSDVLHPRGALLEIKWSRSLPLQAESIIDTTDTTMGGSWGAEPPVAVYVQDEEPAAE